MTATRKANTGYGSPAYVAQGIREWLGKYAGENTASLLLYEAMKALEAITPPAPAPATQADERAAFEAAMRSSGRNVGRWLADKYEDFWAQTGWEMWQATRQQSATPPECTCPSGNGSLRHPCPVHPIGAVVDANAIAHPTSRYLFKKLCKLHGIEPGCTIADALDKIATPADAASEADKRNFHVDEMLERFKNPLTPYGMLVRALRIVTNKSLMDMANYVGKRPSQLSAMEHGRTPVTYQDAVDASAFFNGCGIPVTLHALEYARDVQRERQQGAGNA